MSNNKKVTVHLVEGVEGLAVYINDIRVAGPKPWGGGRTVKKWKTEVKNIKRALNES